MKSIVQIPQAASGDTAYIRGKLIDRKGNLVKGAQFRIRSDAIPGDWEAIGPPPDQADGTVVFPVTRGRFSVRVVGGRSQEAGWMTTGAPGQQQMSDWEFVFQTTN